MGKPKKNCRPLAGAAQVSAAQDKDKIDQSSSELQSKHLNQSSEGDEPKSTECRRVPRRNLLTAGSWLIAACGVGAVIGTARFVIPETTDQAIYRFPLGSIADFKMSTVTWIREKEIFVIRDQRGWGAFSSKCTHLGCTVQRTSEGFTCPCHGAQYDSIGEVVSGPARRALPWFTVWQETDGRIWVDVSRIVDSGTAPIFMPGQIDDRPAKANKNQEQS